MPVQNAYLFNGKELNEDLGLNWLDYGARWYDPSVGRWNAVDPLSEKTYGWSPYCYVYNNPMIFIDPNGMTGESVIKGNTITINSEFVFYGNIEGNESNIKKDVRGTQKAWNKANAKVAIDGMVYKIKYKITAQFVDGSTQQEAIDNATPSQGGRSYIDVCKGCNTGIEHGGGRGQLNVDDILNEERTFTHEYGHENGFIDDNQIDNSTLRKHDEIGLPGPGNTRVPSIMTPRELPADAPKKYGFSSFGTTYTKDGMIDARNEQIQLKER